MDRRPVSICVAMYCLDRHTLYRTKAEGAGVVTLISAYILFPVYVVQVLGWVKTKVPLRVTDNIRPVFLRCLSLPAQMPVYQSLNTN